MTLSLDEAIDALCQAECGVCGEYLPQPGEQCSKCRELPAGMTRAEAAAELAAQPGRLAEIEAAQHREKAAGLRAQWEAEHREADRILLAARFERARDEAEGRFQSAIGDLKTAGARLGQARGVEATAVAAHAEAFNLRRDYALDVDKTVRFRHGTRAEIEARATLTVAETVLAERTQARDEAVTARQHAEDTIAAAEALVTEREAERDQAAYVLANMAVPEMSPDTVRELAAPLTRLATLATFTRQGWLPAGEAISSDEIGLVMAMAYAIAGACGVLDAERNKARIAERKTIEAEEAKKPRVSGATVLAPGARAVAGGVFSPGSRP
jgi:hypothetical protein